MTYPYGHPGGPPQGGPSLGAPPGQRAPGGYPQFAGYGPVYASWGQRAGAYLIDLAPLLAGLLAALLLTMVSGIAGTIVYALTILGNVAWTVVNRWINGGNTGQSLGKRVVGIKLVSEATGEPIGAGTAFVRDLAHALDSLAFALGFLWPLWDDKAQTFSDKILNTVVVPVPSAPRAGGYGQPGGFPAAQPGFGAPHPGFGQPPAPGTGPRQGFGHPGHAGQPQPMNPHQRR
ncbi:RDD family protein [Amycolatopsis sp. WGS_07]|uniref:RDD family protein n=1 Tax=Amycolatopsis sp. WGS_07 TaxID=3076764 RepID=UPI0038734393